MSEPLEKVSPGDPAGELLRADRINALIDAANKILRPMAPPSSEGIELHRAVPEVNYVYVKTPVPAQPYTIWRIISPLAFAQESGHFGWRQAYEVDVPTSTCDPFVVLLEPCDGENLARAAVSGFVWARVRGEGPFVHPRPGDVVFLEAGQVGSGRYVIGYGDFAIVRLGENRWTGVCDELQDGQYQYGYQYGYQYDVSDCEKCILNLCVERDYTGAIRDIFYVRDDGTRVRVPDCTYGSAPSGGDGGGEGGNGDDGGNGYECCEFEEGTPYTATFDIEFNGNSYTGTLSATAFSHGVTFYGFLNGPLCGEEYQYPFSVDELSLICDTDNFLEVFLRLFCNEFPECLLTLNPSHSDFDITITNCNYNPTIILTIKPGRCASGTIVITPS